MIKNNRSMMHGLSDIGSNVPAFLIKLWKLVNDPDTDEIICWSESKLSFIIQEPARFARELLSMYYKHNNMASFIRQLNMYGFHKIVTEAGGLKNDKDCMEFAHQCFIKDHPYLLENIKRKLPNSKSSILASEQFANSNVKNGTQSEILAKVLSDVNNLKGKQESWDARLASMKRENEALWRELAIFRQKHLKQEQIINRLIHFIVTMVQPSRNVPLRRRFPLMLNDIQPVKKIIKLSGAGSGTIVNQGSPTGPTIHEIDNTDVLFRSPEESEITSCEVEFISPNLGENAQSVTNDENSDGAAKLKEDKEIVRNMENIPENWLEVELTEGDVIDPLTPIDPAKVNPAVAAATLKHLGGNSAKKNSSSNIITGPLVAAGEVSRETKKNSGEKKIVYLTGEKNNIGQKSLRKRKPAFLKLDVTKKSNGNDGGMNALENSILDLVSKGEEDSRQDGSQIFDSAVSPANPTNALLMDSNEYKTDFGSGGEESSKDAFLKLDSLYNGTICLDQLGVEASKEPSGENQDGGKGGNSFEEEKRSSSAGGLDDPSAFTSKISSKEMESEFSFDPENMAIVCQQPSAAESLAREFNSHTDAVQGEIDYLKEMLKGEGSFTFDPNTLPWIFNDDSLPYGVLPIPEEETDEKKSEDSGISGNELMTYGAPNLMDLADMIGSTPNSQDWPGNAFSPASPPAVTDLATPSPSPSAFGSFNSAKSPAKRRKRT